MLAALNQGSISGAVAQFADDFTFTDHALGLQLSEKDRLAEFLQKSRQLFPDTVVEVVSTSSSPTDLSPNGAPGDPTVGRTLRGSIEAVTMIADESFPRHVSLPRPFRSHGEGRCSGLSCPT